MEHISNFLLAVLAFGVCIWGLILLVRLLKGIEERKLEIWLDFIKVFLGTFVVGLLGYFAKLSFDNRNLAILESAQIGEYVEQAMEDDLEVRYRFAKYFDTVLPKDRKTGWKEYYEDLKEALDQREIDRDSLEKDMASLNSVASRINAGTALEEDKQEFEQLTQRVNKRQIDIELTEKIIGSRSSSHASIVDIATSAGLDDDRLPVNKTTEFAPGRVYMACRIYAPKAEMVTINWRDDAQNILHSKRYPISINKDAGYRLSSYKNLTDAGRYSVEVVNSIGSVIGRVNFEISNPG